MPKSRVQIRDIQRPLRERYTSDPNAARTVLRVTNLPSDLADPLHCDIHTKSGSIHSGAHELVGGTGDCACSGDLLLAALAACQEITLRMVAANMGIDLESVHVEVEGDWDARGTLAMGAPIGLTNVRCRTRVVIAEDERGERADKLLRSAEKYCVVLNTLRSGVPVESTFELATGGGPAPR